MADQTEKHDPAAGIGVTSIILGFLGFLPMVYPYAIFAPFICGGLGFILSLAGLGISVRREGRGVITSAIGMFLCAIAMWWFYSKLARVL